VTKKANSQNIFIQNFCCLPKKSFEEFAGDFALFAICFSTKFDEIDTLHITFKPFFTGQRVLPILARRPVLQVSVF
jgi:hypothetical protein